MASTSTNKQPLLVDRPLHYAVSLDNALNTTIDIVGINTAKLVVDAISTDGAIIEHIYTINRGATAAEQINLYLSSSSDYLRPDEGILIGTFESASDGVGSEGGEISHWRTAPKVLAPVAHVKNGDETIDANVGVEAVQLRALYIPKGRALWAARQSDTVLTNGPILGCQGGWY